MLVCHFSDWHGNFRKLPKADLYVCTGDMLPNFTIIKVEDINNRLSIKEWCPNETLLDGIHRKEPVGVYAGRVTDPLREANLQSQWISMELKNGGFRRWLSSPDSPIVIVRGNHDFTDISPGFAGCNVWEVSNDSSRTTEVLGLKIGGVRGINYIIGEWDSELRDTGFIQHAVKSSRFKASRPPAGDWDTFVNLIPNDIDILISHAPPKGMFDDVYGENIGSLSLRSYVERRLKGGNKKLLAHFFGHVHERHGNKKLSNILFSNMAQQHMVYEL